MICAESITVKAGEAYLLHNVSFQLNDTEHLIITGSSGSGKTILAKVLAGKIFASGSLKLVFSGNKKNVFVEQRMTLKNKSNTTDGYYQQRYNSYDNEDSDTVLESLVKVKNDAQRINFLSDQFNVQYILDKPLLQLSSGEHKRFQLMRALLEEAQLLIFDEPFTGLDVESRKNLGAILEQIGKYAQLIVIAGAHFEYLDVFTHVLELKGGKVNFFGRKEDYAFKTHISDKARFDLSEVPLSKNSKKFAIAVQMTNVSVKYGEKQILHSIHWLVKKGERWLVRGRNGSGKSTLLSLINGDNPQAYANDIILFDRKRGTGESIWDIKRNIGFMSSELYAYFDKTITCFETIASGFFDTIGLYRKLTEEQIGLVHTWLNILHMQHEALKTLSSVPQGKQRLLLLARALVKDPPLLILDEPCQGLDGQQTKAFVNLVDKIAGNTDKTIIYVSHYDEEIPDCIKYTLSLN